MNFPKNLVFKEDKLKQILEKIDDLYNESVIDYEEIKKLLDKISSISKYKVIINDEDLFVLELIQMECYLKTNCFVEGFNKLGIFAEIPAINNKSGELVYYEYLTKMKYREEEI